MSTKLKNKTHLKETGSLMNLLMGNNNTAPVVGKGATICLYSDRHAYQVMEVSEDGKRIIMQQCNAKRTDNEGMSECQEYDYSELNGHNEEFVYRNGAWRRARKSVELTDSFSKYIAQETYTARQELLKDCWDDNANLIVVEGKTRIKRTFEKIHVLFGVQRQYYDFTR